MTKEKTGMTFLTAQMNADLLTEDLKKKRASNQGFWLVGRPDVELRKASKADAGSRSLTPRDMQKQIPHPRRQRSPTGFGMTAGGSRLRGRPGSG